MNRWDATANEPDMAESVRQQHLDRGLEFLCDELHLYDRQEAAKHRMFFLSAREALLKRNRDPSSSPRSGGFAEGLFAKKSSPQNLENLLLILRP